MRAHHTPVYPLGNGSRPCFHIYYEGLRPWLPSPVNRQSCLQIRHPRQRDSVQDSYPEPINFPYRMPLDHLDAVR